MSLVLFEHNKRAYEAALSLMDEEGKAAVIHPTGTGKSFLTFKLAQEHPGAVVLWLSPSAYIFRTQVENLKTALGGTQKALAEADRILSGIHFLTYTKLMQEEAQQVASMETPRLTPDYIVLDEFHRCGAAEWGKSVRKLLADCPNAKILGLSATSIRYLDGQRDMAEELFDGQIASEITLGEAIVRGILPAPTYVISMYAYRNELEKYKKRELSVRNPVLQKENERILEQLKRALEHAEGLDQVFARHMERKDGKYLVFCSSRQHMEEMIERAKEWFALVDQNPHIYTATCDDPETEQTFAEFQADDSGHLKLLFCIDMFNEGVHVKDIDGVILLRPTVSPTLYLQQVGRGLSVGGGKRPLIFDIVNNFENLYSIDSLQKEIEQAFFNLSCSAEEKERIHGSFRIIDEVRECRALFEQLRKNLSASWDIYYREAEKYYQQNHHLRIPKSYVTQEGLTLGLWLKTQRRVRAGKIAGRLTEEQAAALERIGMEWKDGAARSWERGYEALLSYKKQYGNIDVKVGYVTEDGFALGKWVSNIRQNRNVDEIQKTVLDELGMIWDKHSRQWEISYQAAAAYYQQYGHLRVPRSYHTKDGISLGVWIANQRSIYAGKKKGAAPLSEHKIHLLNLIGMKWSNRDASIF